MRYAASLRLALPTLMRHTPPVARRPLSTLLRVLIWREYGADGGSLAASGSSVKTQAVASSGVGSSPAPSAKAKFCPSCGAAAGAGNFCGGCGAKLSA